MKYKIHHEKETQGLPYNVSKKRIKEGGGGGLKGVFFFFRASRLQNTTEVNYRARAQCLKHKN